MLKTDLKHKIANIAGVSILALSVGFSVAKPAIEITQAITPHETVFADKSKGSKGGSKGSKGSKRDDAPAPGKGKGKKGSKDDDKKGKDKQGTDGSDGGGDDSGGGGSQGQGDSYSFYHLASSAAIYFDGSQNPDIKYVKYMDGKTMSQPQYWGNAGGLIGYEDSQYDKKNWIGSVTSALSSSAQGHSYNTYPNEDTNDLYYYALYGHALASLGLDSTAPQEGITSIFRWLFGIIMMVGYALAIGVDLIFAGVGQFLRLFNPFQFFDPQFIYGGNKVEQSPATSDFADPFREASHVGQSVTGAGNPLTGIGNIWQSVGNILGHFYGWAQNAGIMITIPSCILIALGMLVLGRASRQRGVSMFKKAFLRLVIIIVGVPIFASFYNSALNGLSLKENTNLNANIVLAETFDDFENWASNTRLALPVGTNITLGDFEKNPSGSLLSDAEAESNNKDINPPVRQLAVKINSVANMGLVDAGTSVDDLANDMWSDKGNSSGNNPGDTQNANGGTNKLTAGFILLSKYISGSKYTAAQYETMYKSHLDDTPEKATENNKVGSKTQKGAKASADNSERAKILRGIKYLASDPGNFYNDKVAYFTPNQQPKDTKNGWVNFLWNSGSLGNSKGADAVGADVKPGAEVIVGNGSSYDADKKVKNVKATSVEFKGNGPTKNDGDSNYNYGLSSLSMYNYLTTEFSDSTITVYSPNKISSMFVMKEHHSVNLVGTGMNQVCYYLNALVLFIAIIIIGWGYALATLTGVLGSELKVLLHIPVMLLGGLNSAAKFFATVAVMIIQIFSTIFLYTLAINFLMAINLGTSPIFETASQRLGSNGAGLGTNNAGMIMFADAQMHNPIGSIVYLIISTLITMGFAIVALKVRGKFVRAMSEWIGDLIDRLLMTGTYNPQISNNYMTNNGGASQEIMNTLNSGSNVSQGFSDGLSTGDNNNENTVENADGTSTSTEVNNNNGDNPSQASNATGSDEEDQGGGAQGFDGQSVPSEDKPESVNSGEDGAKETGADQNGGKIKDGDKQGGAPISSSAINSNNNNQSSVNQGSPDQTGNPNNPENNSNGDTVNNKEANSNNSAKNLNTKHGDPTTQNTSTSANENMNSMNHDIENNSSMQNGTEPNAPRSEQGAVLNHDGSGSGANNDTAESEAPNESAVNNSQNGDQYSVNGDLPRNVNGNQESTGEPSVNSESGNPRSLGQMAMRSDGSTVANTVPENQMQQETSVDNSQDNDTANSLVKNDPRNSQTSQNTANNSMKPYTNMNAHNLNTQQDSQNAQNANNNYDGNRQTNSLSTSMNNQNAAGDNVNSNLNSASNSNMSNLSNNNSNNAQSNLRTEGGANTMNNNSNNAPKTVNSQNSNSRVSSLNGSSIRNSNGMPNTNNIGARHSAINTQANVKNINGLTSQSSHSGIQTSQNSLTGSQIKGANILQNGTGASGVNSVKGARQEMNMGTRNLTQTPMKMANGKLNQGTAVKLPRTTAQNGQPKPMNVQAIKRAQVNASPNNPNKPNENSGVRQGMKQPYVYTPNRTFAKGLAQKAVGAGKILMAPGTLAKTGSLSQTVKSVQNAHVMMNNGGENMQKAINMRQTAKQSRETISQMASQAQTTANAESQNPVRPTNTGVQSAPQHMRNNPSAMSNTVSDAAKEAGQTAQAAQENAIHAPEDTMPLNLDDVPDDARQGFRRK